MATRLRKALRWPFKRLNGSYLIGFYTTAKAALRIRRGQFFLSQSGQWADVSRKSIANYSKEKYVYELPNGTTVQVFEKDENGTDWNKGKQLYDLVGRWAVILSRYLSSIQVAEKCENLQRSLSASHYFSFQQLFPRAMHECTCLTRKLCRNAAKRFLIQNRRGIRTFDQAADVRR